MSRLCRLGVLPKLGLDELWWRIHKEGEKGWGVVCGDAAPCVGHKLGGRGNVNGLEWWAVVFDIVGSVSAREWWAGKNGESMRQTE